MDCRADVVDMPVPKVVEEHVCEQSFPRGTGFNGASRSRVSAGNASRSVELNRLPGKWRRCPSIRQTRVRSFGSIFRDVLRQGLSFHELERLLLQFQKDTVDAGSGVNREASD